MRTTPVMSRQPSGEALIVKRFAMATLLALALPAAFLPSMAHAQSMDDKWQFQAILYGYFPSLGGTTSFPAGSSGSIDVDSNQLLSNLNFTVMGTFEARRGKWGIFTDLIYLDVSGSSNGTRDFTVGHRDIPAGVSGNLALDLKGTLWTLAGEYRVASSPALDVDVLVGARLLDLQEKLSYSLTADVGPITGPGRSGSTEVDQSYWDAVVGVKGRYMFGERHEWFLPYYADVGAGQSDLTWQVFGGVGYSFSWGSVLAGWRYLDYKFASDSKVQDLTFNGPMVGVAFRW